MKPHLLLMALAVALLSACTRQPPAEEPVRAVKVLRVGQDPYGAGLAFSGEVRARVESRLGFRVAGKLARRLVEPGQRVQAGQLLAQLDASDLQLSVDAVRAQVEAARTQRDLAAAEFRRFQSLKEQNFISGAELERREAQLKAAQAQLDQAQAQLSVQSNQAAYGGLRADVSGVVTAIEAEVGQVLAAGTPVVRLAADGPRDVVFSVPEHKVSGLRPGMAVRVQPWSEAPALAGRVREVSASADPATRTFLIKAALEGSTGLPLGATVNVAVPGLGGGGLEGKPVIKLPTSALRQEGQGSAVWLLDEASMTVKLQPVAVATFDGNQAVIASGLQPGMLVVATGVHVLSPGQKVSMHGGKPVAP